MMDIVILKTKYLKLFKNLNSTILRCMLGGRRKIVVVLAVLATNLSARNTPNQRKGIAKAKNGCFEVELAVDEQIINRVQ